MHAIRSRPGPPSVVGGVIFAVILYALGGGPSTPIKLALAVLLGAVFAVALHTAMRRYREPPSA